MRRISWIIMAMILLLGVAVSASQAKIGNDNRMAVVYEAWYALRSSYLSSPNAEGPHDGLNIQGNTASDWNYLATDVNAMNYVAQKYGSNKSVSIYFGSNDIYGKKIAANGIRYGRGGQCTYFAALILYRSNRYTLLWNWNSINPQAYPWAENAQPGDLVFKRSGIQHVGICVKRLSGGGIDIVDSNYVGYGNRIYSIYGNYNDSEIIARHSISYAQIHNEGWRVYSGRGRWY